MVPQNRPLNQTYWARLEALIRTWVEDGVVHDAKVITGGFFYDPAEDDPRTADGLVPFAHIGRGNVAVPTHVFKIVVGQNARNELQAIAFVVKNEKPPKNARLEDAIVAIAWLEERAGLNFMPDLTPAQERALKRCRRGCGANERREPSVRVPSARRRDSDRPGADLRGRDAGPGAHLGRHRPVGVDLLACPGEAGRRGC
jgi:hypothetical protein